MEKLPESVDIIAVIETQGQMIFSPIKLSPMNTTQKLLWQKIEGFQLDIPKVGFSFSKRLARENNWTQDYAKAVVKEYKRFLYLMTITTHPVIPSEPVKQAWHLHLLYTQSYWIGFCERIVGSPLHHSLIRDEIEGRDTFRDSYEFTLEMYRVSFQEEAPENIWSSVDVRLQELKFSRKHSLENHAMAS